MAPDDGIDTTDYVILAAITEPVWKSRIFSNIEDTIADRPIDTMPSPQTINRRIDRLCDDGHLSSCILSPDDVDRDLIIGYKCTEAGNEAMGAKRSDLLEEVAHTPSNSACAMEREVTKNVLVKLVADEFALDDAAVERITNEYSESEILSLLALHYAQLNADKFATHNRAPGQSSHDTNFQSLVD